MIEIMFYFSKQDVIYLHSNLILKFGGSDGIRDEGMLESALNTPLQTFDSSDLYPTPVDKIARLSFGLAMDHPFYDGNKRIAATLFLHFINMNNALFNGSEKRISDNTLVALTIMIAESKPEEKEAMVALVMSFLAGE